MEDLTGHTIYRPDRELKEDTDMTTAIDSIPITCKECFDFSVLTKKAADYSIVKNEDDPRARKPIGPLRERWTGRPITPGPFMMDKLGDDPLTMFQAHEPTPSKYALYLKPGGMGENEFNPVPKEPSPPIKILSPDGVDLPPPIQRTRWWSGPARDPANILNEKCPKIIDLRQAEREEREAKRAARSPKKQPRRRVSISTIPIKTGWSSSDEDDGSLSPKPRSLSPVSYRRPALFMRSPTTQFHMIAKDGSIKETIDVAGVAQEDGQEAVPEDNVESDYPRTGYFPRPDNLKPEKLENERKTVIVKPSKSVSPCCSPLLLEDESDADYSMIIKEEDKESTEWDSKRWLGTPKTTTVTSRRSRRIKGTPYCFLYGNNSDPEEDKEPTYPKKPSPWRQDVIATEPENAENRRKRLEEKNPWGAPDAPKMTHFATNPAPPIKPVRYGERPIYTRKVDLFDGDPELQRPFPVIPMGPYIKADCCGNAAPPKETVEMHPSILKKCPPKVPSMFSPECQCKPEPIPMPENQSSTTPLPKRDRSKSPVPAPIGPFLRTYVLEPEIKSKEKAVKKKDSLPHEIWPDGRYKMTLPIPLRKTSEQKMECCEDKDHEEKCNDKPQEEPGPPRRDADIGPWPADKNAAPKENPEAPFMFECAQCPFKDMSVDIGPAIFDDDEIKKVQKDGKKAKIIRYSADPSEKNPMNRYGKTLPIDKRNMMICKFCKLYLHEPRMLPCMHSFCSECLKTYFIDQKKGVPAFCPICDAKFCFPQHKVSGFIRAYWLDRMMEYGRRMASYRKGPCINSKDDNTHPYAEFKCKECKVDFCLECDFRHRQQYVSHKSRNIEDIVKETLMSDYKSHQFVCARHPCAALEFYCQSSSDLEEVSCKKPLCKQCADLHKVDGHDVVSLSKAANIFREHISVYEKEQYLKVEREIDSKIKLLAWYKRELMTANREVHEVLTVRERKARAFVYTLQKYLQDKLAILCRELLRENQAELFALTDKHYEWKLLELKCVTIRMVAMMREIVFVYVDANNYVNNSLRWLPNSPKYCRILYGESEEFNRAFATLGCLVRKRKFLRKYKALACPVESIAAYRGKKSIVIFSIHRSFIKNKRSTVYVTALDREEREEWRKMLRIATKMPYSAAYVEYENKNCLAIVDRRQNVGPTEPRSTRDMNLTWRKYQLSKAKPKIIILTPGRDPVKIKNKSMFNPLCVAPVKGKSDFIYSNASIDEYNPSLMHLRGDCGSRSDTLYHRDDTSLNQLEWPECVCTDSYNNLVILDTVMEKIFFMNSDGVISHSYFIPVGGKKNVPGSIAVDRYDNIYVSYKDGHRVDRLYPNGDFECEYLTEQDGVQNPTSLCCHKNILLVGEASGHVGLYAIEKNHNILKVFGVDSGFKLRRKGGMKSGFDVSGTKSARFAEQF